MQIIPTRERRNSGPVNISTRLPSNIGLIEAKNPFQGKDVKKAVVLWFSQTGNTGEKGKIIAEKLNKEGVQVTSGDIRDTGLNSIKNLDLIVIGSPVFYYEIPDYVKKFIKSLPELTDIPVASYVTYAGRSGNQHNAVCSVIEEMVNKGGIPVGLESFRSSNSFVLGTPDIYMEETAETGNKDAENFALYLLEEIKNGRSSSFRKKLTLKESSISKGPFWWTKKFVTEHRIDREKCNGCKRCVELCPEKAIDPANYTIDLKRCTLCLGCINNCKEGAVKMKYNDTDIKGIASSKQQPVVDR